MELALIIIGSVIFGIALGIFIFYQVFVVWLDAVIESIFKFIFGK